METIIYISNVAVKILRGYRNRGKYHIMSQQVVPLRQGVVESGQIKDEEEIIKILKEIKCNEVCCIINVSSVYWKITTVPNMNSSLMMEIVKKELNDVVAHGYEYVYDYRKLKMQDEEGISILCIAIEKGIVEQYMRIFKKAHLNLVRLDVSLNSLIKFYENIDSLKEGTFVTIKLDDKDAATFLFVKGKFKYFGKKVLKNERGTEGEIIELTNLISQIVQFKRANHREVDIEKIFFSGISDEELKSIKEVAKNLFHLDVGNFSDFNLLSDSRNDINIGDFIYLLGSAKEAE